MSDIEAVQLNLNFLWVLMAASLVFLMQAGFMCLESGLARAKNSINVAIKNLADFVLGVVSFWLIGFGLMFGLSQGGWIGFSDFMIPVDDPWRTVFFVFQAVFVGTAATIDSGAVAGRTKFSAYLVTSILVATVIYPVFGHWAWAGLFHDQAGWLEARGFIDFAGSSVVHSVGGWVALAGVIIVGPRIGRFDEDGKPRRIPPHNMTMAYLGTFILFFGWFGFNCGSTLEATSDIAAIAMNTMLAACFGCVSSSALSWLTSPFKRPEGEMIANGILGGLVAITAGCASVNTVGAMWIGLGAGVVVFVATWLLESVLKVDDVVGAIPVHGFCGAWGTLSLAFFITPENMGEGMSRLNHIGVQGLGVLVCFLWAFGAAFIILKFIDWLFGGLRVSAEDEAQGLNITEHGASSGILDLAQSMQRATQTGSFTDEAKVEIEEGTEVGDLGRCFNQMVDAVQGALSQTRKQVNAAETARRAAEEAGTKLDSERADHSEYIEQMMQELTSMMGETRGTMQQIAKSCSAVEMSADELRAQSKRIDGFVQTIETIATTSRMLALNAQIEAARAGEAGKSFSVVAEEMGTLSENSRTATSEITRVTMDIHQRLQEMTENMQHMRDTIGQGVNYVQEASGVVQQLLARDNDGQAASATP